MARFGAAKITPTVRRRIIWAVVIAAALIVLVVGILLFADTFAINESGRRCATNFEKSKWPMYIGCAMAAHEDLAAGLIGGAGALFAAWLAFDAIQEQLSEERQRRLRQQFDAKATAVMGITQLVRMAAATLWSIGQALKADDAAERIRIDQDVELGERSMRVALDSFLVRESVRDLGVDDRLLFISIIDVMGTFVNIFTHLPSNFDRKRRLEYRQKLLLRLHRYLPDFDAKLGKDFVEVSETTSENADLQEKLSRGDQSSVSDSS